jgi:membrane protease YdiL (CAAX protease family)
VSYRPPGTLRALRILASNSALRLLRLADVQRSRRQQESRRAKSGGRRRATSRKRGGGLTWLMLLVLPIFALQAVVMSRGAVDHLVDASNCTAPPTDRVVLPMGMGWRGEFALQSEDDDQLREVLDRFGVDESSRPPRSTVLAAFREHGAPRYGGGSGPAAAERAAAARSARFYTAEAEQVFARTCALLLLTLALMSLCSAVGGANSNLGGGDWIQWWLMTFPVPTRSLTLARAFEYALVQLFPWFTLFPLTWQVLAALGQPWALPIAAGAALTTTFFNGALRLWIETQLRLRCSLRTLKSVQGACTIGALLMIGLVFFVALNDVTPYWFVDLAASLPAALLLAPGTWPIGLSVLGPLAAAVGVSVSAAAFAASVAATGRALRGGVMRTGGVDAGARKGARLWTRGRALGIGGKELALLKRDRTFLVQTVLVPVFIIGIQLVVNTKLGDSGGAGVAIIAYVVGFYGATGGCFQVLSSEGRALWMLYALPISTLEILRRKTRIWAALCAVLGTAALVVFSLRARADLVDFARDLVFVLVGVWCAAHIAAAISVLGANTTPDAVQRNPKQRYSWLFLFLAGPYAAVLAMDELGHRVAGATVFATLTFAIWRRGVERMRWMLDPVTDPHGEVRLLDAAGVMFAFFLLQVLAALLFSSVSGDEALATMLAFAAAGAGALVFAAVRLDSRGIQLGPAFGLEAAGAARQSVIAGAFGLGLGGLGLLYVQLVESVAPDAVPPVPSDGLVFLFVLAVFAAPVIEELLFRGLLLGALLRSVPAAVAGVWSALLFTFVHPMVSWPPVFLLGVLCAALRLRGWSVVACMVLHAVYNAVVVGLR